MKTHKIKNTLREGNNVLNKYEIHLGQILEEGTEFCGARKTW